MALGGHSPQARLNDEIEEDLERCEEEDFEEYVIFKIKSWIVGC